MVLLKCKRCKFQKVVTEAEFQNHDGPFVHCDEVVWYNGFMMPGLLRVWDEQKVRKFL